MFNKKHAVSALIVLCVLSVSLFAGGNSEEAQQDNEQTVFEGPIPVYTSILPQKYFVEKIGGDRVKVEVLVGPGKNPATYEPTPQQVEGLGSAGAFFSIGVPFEKAFLPVISSTLPSLNIIHTEEGIKRRHLEAHSHADEEDHDDEHGHDEDHEDDHLKIEDPHIWLSPRLVKKQAENIFTALVKLDPAGKEAYESGYNAFLKELDEVDAELAEALKPYTGSEIFVFHPAFGYFTSDYGLSQVAVETGGKEPSPAVLEEVIGHAKEENVKIIFVQPEFSKSSANAIAEAIGGAVVSLAPLNPDYINNLKHIVDEIKKAAR